MRRRKVLPPVSESSVPASEPEGGPRAKKHRGYKPKGVPNRTPMSPFEKSPAAQADEAKRVNDVLVLLIGGVPPKQIAEKLDVDLRTVARLIEAALEDYREENARLVQRYAATNVARLDRIIRAFLPDAMGDASRDVKPMDRAAKIVIMAAKEQQSILGTRVRVEHVGDGGGPIRTSFDVARFSDEQLARIIAASGPADLRGVLQAPGSGGDGAPPPDGDEVH